MPSSNIALIKKDPSIPKNSSFEAVYFYFPNIDLPYRGRIVAERPVGILGHHDIKCRYFFGGIRYELYPAVCQYAAISHTQGAGNFFTLEPELMIGAEINTYLRIHLKDVNLFSFLCPMYVYYPIFEPKIHRKEIRISFQISHGNMTPWALPDYTQDIVRVSNGSGSQRSSIEFYKPVEQIGDDGKYNTEDQGPPEIIHFEVRDNSTGKKDDKSVDHQQE